MKYKAIILDFDGVLAETNDVRFEGFVELFRDYPKDQLEHFIDYVQFNGGISRYEKIRYFFNEIRKESISDEEIRGWAEKYSKVVKRAIIDAKPVEGSLEFLENYASVVELVIVSGSDQEELRSVCKARGIAHYFIEILGSPLQKESNILNLLTGKGWDREACLYVGDSINDYEAAQKTGIDFVGRNSGLIDWKTVKNVRFIDNLQQLCAIFGESC